MNRFNDISRFCFLLAFCLTASLLAISCSDSELQQDDTARNLFSLSEQSISLSAKEQYYSLQLKSTSNGLKYSMESDADWLTVVNDSVPEDGWFDIKVDLDDTYTERTAQLTIIGTDGEHSQTTICKITQCEDDGTNSYEEETSKSMRVGYGYCIFDKYMNDISVRKPILSASLLSDSNDDSRIIETNSRSVLDVDKTVSKNLVEYAEMLTKKQEKESTGIKGSNKTVKETQASGYNAKDLNYVNLRYYKTSAMRSLDVGVLNEMLGEGKHIFTNDFEDIRNSIIEDPSNTDKIYQMLNEYGTHMVVQAELGVSIELNVSFEKDMKGELNMRVDDFVNYFFNAKNSSFVLGDKVKNLTSTIKTDVNCHIFGGGKEATENLKKDINKNGRVSSEYLLAWLNSSSGSIEEDAVAKNLVPTNFKLIPIWNLFPAKSAGAIVDAIDKMGERQSNLLTDAEIGTDYYKIDLTDEMLSFSNSTDATLVRVVYIQGSPILEICNEYVPKIRGDKRISVVYGIDEGSSFIGAGFFPGDGEGNPPAWLTFSDGDCYVNTIKGYDSYDKLRTIYYMNGRIYEKNYDMPCLTPKNISVVDHYLTLGSDKDVNYPIVKIGSGYWSRKNVCQTMYWDEEHTESINQEDMLYACVYQNTSTMFEGFNEYFYGDTTDDTEQRRKWYLPIAEDRKNLTKYVGSNLKVLFPNQVSGFEAEFVGYYGAYDNNGKRIDANFEKKLRNNGSHCFITFKECEKDSQGEVFILSGNYTWESVPLSGCKYNYYPIRLFRTSNFIYK